MRTRLHNPDTVAPPSSAYAHGVEVLEAERFLMISGQVPLNVEGVMPPEPARQHEICWERIFEVLKSAGMTVENLVFIRVFLTRAADVALYREVRDRMLDGHVCGSTLLVVEALAHPEWTVEIEAVAAA